MQLFFKIFAGLFAFLFSWAAYLQSNDPDALLWYLIYGGASLSCITFITGKLGFLVAFFISFIYLVGAWFSWPQQFEGVTIGKGDITNIEQAREALGLLICAAVFLVLALRLNWKRKAIKRL